MSFLDTLFRIWLTHWSSLLTFNQRTLQRVDRDWLELTGARA